MASKKGYKLLKKTDGEGNYGSISILGSSSETQAEDKNDKDGAVTTSCLAVLEPSKDESLRSDGRTETVTRKQCNRSSPDISTHEASTSSSGESNDHEEESQSSGEANQLQIVEVPQRSDEEQADEPHGNCCAALMRSCHFYARKIGRSWFMYFFHIFLVLLSVSVIVMGIIYYGSCFNADDKAYPIALLSIFMGLSALPFICLWWRKIHRHRSRQYYYDRERNVLLAVFVVFLFFFMIEAIFFTSMRPENAQSEAAVTCPIIYYDYMYSLHIVMAISFAFAASIYLPDCCIYIFTYRPPVISQANGHYQEPL